MERSTLTAALAAAALAASPAAALACACGCNIFDVGTGSMLPTDAGGVAFLEYNFMDQNGNRGGASSAPAADNPDKEIRTNFYTAGVEYMFTRRWGVSVEAPVWNRKFRTENDDGGVDSFSHTAFGDVRLMGLYTGLSEDLSTGLTLGVKLPTGDWKFASFDRDTQIGTGSTDILVGGYHRGALTKGNRLSYFVQGLADLPVATQGGYRPGDEIDAAAGVYYSAGAIGGGRIKVSPVLQLFGSWRGRDGGLAADPPNTGYERLMISPGVEVSSGPWRIYGDVELPVYQRYNGNQLAAPVLVKIIVSHAF